MPPLGDGCKTHMTKCEFGQLTREELALATAVMASLKAGVRAMYSRTGARAGASTASRRLFTGSFWMTCCSAAVHAQSITQNRQHVLRGVQDDGQRQGKELPRYCAPLEHFQAIIEVFRPDISNRQTMFHDA